MGHTHDEIAAKLGIAPTTAGRYITGGSRTNQYHQLNALLRQAYAISVVAEELTDHQFRPRDLDDTEDWDADLTRLIISARRLRAHLRTLTDTEGTRP
jgi:hypothetical protein